MQKRLRIIPRLDIKNNTVIKGINLEGLRVVGEPGQMAEAYYCQGADELIFMDAVASLYDRNGLHDIIHKAADQIFIPITVGGGVRSVEDVAKMLDSGADKVAINTAAIKDPGIISKVAERFGAQCMVLSIEAKLQTNGVWEAYYDNGRERSGLDVVDWARQAEELGAGEILVTSVDCEGMCSGFDVALYSKIRGSVKVPVIASGGFGRVTDILKLSEDHLVDAVAVASALHYKKTDIKLIKSELMEYNVEIRRVND